MSDKTERDGALASNRPAENIGANSANNNVVRFRKQGLRTTAASLGQLAAISNRVRDYEHTVDELRALLAAAIDLDETLGAELEAKAADQGVTLVEQPAASDWRPEPGAGLLGALGSIRSAEPEGDAAAIKPPEGK